MDFRTQSQELADKENQGIPEKCQNGEKPQVVSILKSSQKGNGLLEPKKLSKVCTISVVNTCFSTSSTVFLLSWVVLTENNLASQLDRPQAITTGHEEFLQSFYIFHGK